jgi:general secretion pathway protein A
MYLSHYNLKEKPFQISTDPKFIWLGENHREALAVLKYGVIDNKGFLLITGDVGTGKTTLVNALLLQLGNDIIVANITNPILEKLDFLNTIANEFNINRYFNNKADFLIHFSRFLHDCYKKKKKVVLIIDEAHKLNNDLLEEIRVLSNIERKDTKLISIFFVGQNEFIGIISDKKKRALRQRITLNYHLEPLKESEVREYILHRLNVAGLNKNIFSDNSISEIFSFSNGYPRLINTICDHALLIGYVKEIKKIDKEIIKECENGLFITRGNDDYYRRDPTTRKESAPDVIKKEPTITHTEYSSRLNLEEEKIDYLHDNHKTIESKTHDFIKEPKLKSSGKNIGYVAGTLLLVIMMGFLYHLGNLGGHIENIKTYFKPAPNVQEEIAPINIPKNTTSGQQVISTVQRINEYDDVQPGSTDQSAESYHPSKIKEKNVIKPPKNTDTNELPPSEDLKQGKHPIGNNESRETPEHEFLKTQKYIFNFKYDSYDLSNKSLQTLDRIAEFLFQHSNVKIYVKGYTDSYGSKEYNKKLSKLRANFVKSYFEDKGINSSRIRVFGMGEKNPIKSNKTIEGRRRNRRVEIELNINKT